MLAILFLLFLVCLWGLRFSKTNDDYLPKETTNAIKGIFAVIVLCSHLGWSLSLSDSFLDKTYLHIITYIGQTMVAPFFFISGYGVFYSFRHKPDYKTGFLAKRLFKVLFQFDLTVLLFIVVQALLSIYWPIKNYIWCWIGWESVGNYNWFVFVILSLYLITWIGMLLDKGNGHALIGCTILLSIVLWLVLRFVADKETWWVDTIATFPLGMVYCAAKKQTDRLLLNGRKAVWYIAFFFLLALFMEWHHLHGVDVFGICSCLFSLLLVVTMMKIRIGNPILSFLGRNAFSIFILQGLPMLVLSYYGINCRPSLYILLTIIFTLLLAEGSTRLSDHFYQKWFSAR